MNNDPLPPEKPARGPASSTPPSVTEEEITHLDDAIVGSAFRWSALVFLLLVGTVVAVIFYLNRKPAALPGRKTPLSAPARPATRQVDVPRITFTDVTKSAGIDFVHNNGARGEKLLPETMGSGVAFFDFDDDGDQDLLFVNSTYWPGKIPAGKQPTTAALYANDGYAHFKNVTAGSGLDIAIYGMGVATGDYDNDGRVDVFLTAVGENKLFHNEGGGRFKDVTQLAGVGGSPEEWSTSCAWLDIDNDSDLDLFVANYVRWSREIDFEVNYSLVGIGRAYGPPMNFPGTFPYLYRNEGNGKFTDVSSTSGVQITNSFTGVPLAKSLGVCPMDLDRDGWMDLVVANDTVPNFLFHNRGHGKFEEIGAASSLAFDNYGQIRGAMGIDAAYFRDDGALGIAIGNFANEMTALYVSKQTPLLFTDDAIAEGVGPASRLLLKFGVFFFDYDLDGRLDLLTCNGHLEEEITQIQKSQTYAQPAQLFWNSGQGVSFIPVSPEKAGEDLFKPIVGRGSAFADFDGDGDHDVVLTQTAGPPLLLRNEQILEHRWLRLKLVGTTSNRDAIGALISVTANGRRLVRQVMPTRSYLSQSELPVSVGLGTASQVESIEVTWPNGVVQRLSSPELDRTITISQPPTPQAQKSRIISG